MSQRSDTLDWKYGCLTAVWMGAIYWLSSRSDLGTSDGGTVEQVASNMAHIPLYAGLAFCWLRTLPTREATSTWPYWLTFMGAGLYGVLDEWHQSFVPGRQASFGDVLLDLAGICGMLLVLRLRVVRDIRTLRSTSP